MTQFVMHRQYNFDFSVHADDLYGVCAFDDPNNRTLTGRYEVNENMTIEMCLSICRNGGYPYAGLEWQIECFCGHQPGLFGAGRIGAMKSAQVTLIKTVEDLMQ